MRIPVWNANFQQCFAVAVRFSAPFFRCALTFVLLSVRTAGDLLSHKSRKCSPAQRCSRWPDHSGKGDPNNPNCQPISWAISSRLAELFYVRQSHFPTPKIDPVIFDFRLGGRSAPQIEGSELRGYPC